MTTNANACPRCTGTGRFYSRSGRDCGECYSCKGTGRTALDRANINPAALQPILLAFAFAARTLKAPRLSIGPYRITIAKAGSANAGALYVKLRNHSADFGTDPDSDSLYLGKITDSAFVPSRDCSQEQRAAIVALCADPLAASLAHGRETGRCAICSRTLTDPESLANAVGPVCAKNFGWNVAPPSANTAPRATVANAIEQPRLAL